MHTAGGRGDPCRDKGGTQEVLLGGHTETAAVLASVSVWPHCTQGPWNSRGLGKPHSHVTSRAMTEA